ncbi:exodeoxyribonuclease VII small subunit [Acuticoccus sp.]|uniref:exodeoxyribonuclease VII small subunit n=1 Tax=Acuticoccus sp. TaxID=1904378 RepID=UPI003B5168D9
MDDETQGQLQSPVEAMTFEAAMGELEEIVDRLEKGNVPLEESIAYYERGEALKTRCDDLLKRAEMRVEKVRLRSGGTPSGTEPLDGDADDDVPF